MPDNTLTATPSAEPQATREQVLEAEVAMLRGELAKAKTALHEQQEASPFSEDFAERLFIANLNPINDPSGKEAYQRTMEQIKFLKTQGKPCTQPST